MARKARVRRRVESGMYGSASEVIREALRFFEAYEQVNTARLDTGVASTKPCHRLDDIF